MVTEFRDPNTPSDQVLRQARSSGVMQGAAQSVDGTALGVLWDAVETEEGRQTSSGELVLGERSRARVAGYLRPFHIPEPLVGEPRPLHAALGLLMEARLADDPGTDNVTAALDPVEYDSIRADGVRPGSTTSVIRFLEGIAAMLGLDTEQLHPAEALAEVTDRRERGAYLTHPTQAPDRSWILDWEPLVRAALADLVAGAPVGRIAARVDNGLVDGMTRVTGVMNVETVVLAGRSFRNRHLRLRAVTALRAQGHRVILGAGARRERAAAEGVH